MSPRVTAPIAARMVALFEGGESMAEIARVLGYSAQTVAFHVAGFNQGVRVRVTRAPRGRAGGPRGGYVFTQTQLDIADALARR
jgi:predicted transcriptional regulator